ncbi:hypothetical protein ACJX0J_034406, partial [Zea mays]
PAHSSILGYMSQILSQVNKTKRKMKASQKETSIKKEHNNKKIITKKEILLQIIMVPFITKNVLQFSKKIKKRSHLNLL